jgi:tRNA (guanine-N7-)-methyltransferase
MISIRLALNRINRPTVTPTFLSAQVAGTLSRNFLNSERPTAQPLINVEHTFSSPAKLQTNWSADILVRSNDRTLWQCWNFDGHRRAPAFCGQECPRSGTMIKEAQSLIYDLPSILERLDLSKLFRVHQPLEVELGSGDGTFLVDLAKRHPEHNFIGIERLLGRIRKMERKARRAELANLRGVRIESSYFLEYLLSPHSVEALHIYFPDPWPKRKHRRHRLINERFPQLAHCALTAGGTVYLRTDDRDYFDQMISVFAASPLFCVTETPADLAALLTDFEKDFQARGIATLRAAYQSCPFVTQA